MKPTTLTPKLAQQWLDGHTNFRKPKRTVVKRYAEDIAAGDWRLTNETIGFNGDGTMIDGQHRCLAVIKANVPIQVYVISGIDSAAVEKIDQGTPRSPATLLRAHGIPGYWSATAGIVNVLYRWSLATSGRPPSHLMTSWADRLWADPELMTALGRYLGDGLARDLVIRNASGAAAAAGIWVMHQQDAEAANAFMHRVFAATPPVGPGDPEFTYHRYMYRARAATTGSCVTKLGTLRPLWYAWSKRRAGRKLSMIKVGNLEEGYPSEGRAVILEAMGWMSVDSSSGDE